MSSLGRFEVSGSADPKRYRTATGVDFVAATMIAMIAFPFPILRAMLAVPVFVASILLAIVVVHFAYVAAALMLWGRTPAMYLLDLGLRGGRPSISGAGLWALGALLDFWPTVLGVRSSESYERLADRISGLALGSTAGPTKNSGVNP